MTDFSRIHAYRNKKHLGNPPQSPKTNEPLATSKNVIHILLHLFEPDEAAALTLKVIKHRRQANKWANTPAIRAVINFLLVSGGIEVLFEALECREFSVTKVAFIALPIPSSFRGPQLGVSLAVPLDLLASDEALWVTLTDSVVDGAPVDIGVVWA